MQVELNNVDTDMTVAELLEKLIGVKQFEISENLASGDRTNKAAYEAIKTVSKTPNIKPEECMTALVHALVTFTIQHYGNNARKELVRELSFLPSHPWLSDPETVKAIYQVDGVDLQKAMGVE